VYYTFMLEGIFMGVWSYYLVDIQHKVDLSDSQLGSAVLFVYLGMVVISPFTAYCLKTFGSKASMLLGAILFGISLSLIPLSFSHISLIITMSTYGLSMGIMDISMNSSAILTEIVAGKSLFGGFHGSYSVAAAIGSVVGEVLSANHFETMAVFGALSVGSVILTAAFHANMYNLKQEVLITEYQSTVAAENNGETEENGPRAASNGVDVENDALHKRNRSSSSAEEGVSAVYDVTTSPRYMIAFYSMVGFLAAFGESSMVTWSIVYFHREMHASELLKSLGFICFMACMALGRFSSDVLRATFGRRVMVRVGGAFAFTGLSLVALAPDLPHSIIFGCIGFSITGLGLSTLIPTMLSSAGHIPGGAHAGTSIAIVSMFTNSGAIVSSPLLGMMSDGLGSMRLAFFCEAVLLGVMCVVSWGIPEESSIFKRNSAAAAKTE